MNDYSTALLQIVSTKLTEKELIEGIKLKNHARQQPPPPAAYYCFETSTLCQSDNINEHISKLAIISLTFADFLKECVSRGDDLTLLWFPRQNCGQFSVLSPASMKFLSESKISFLVNNQR